MYNKRYYFQNLTAFVQETFHVEVLKFKENRSDDFYRDLLWAFRHVSLDISHTCVYIVYNVNVMCVCTSQMPGGTNLPNNSMSPI